ncbi:hypothetical protein KAOT1_12557 [Kordia algicida OT-1]|uniref:Uncharacterized protein n=1 Tax=Kordia algicida OT-1 TaxID=391587 RepID=A9DJ81_9FLAO|nr:hypothetical protein KAOT1_12557 [Kordia algicida OT-1]
MVGVFGKLKIGKSSNAVKKLKEITTDSFRFSVLELLERA